MESFESINDDLLYYIGTELLVGQADDAGGRGTGM